MESSLRRGIRDLEDSSSVAALGHSTLPTFTGTQAGNFPQLHLDVDRALLSHHAYTGSHGANGKRRKSRSNRTQGRASTPLSTSEQHRGTEKRPDLPYLDTQGAAARVDERRDAPKVQENFRVADADSGSNSSSSLDSPIRISKREVEDIDNWLEGERQQIESDSKTPILMAFLAKFGPEADEDEIARAAAAETKLDLPAVLVEYLSHYGCASAD